MNVIRLSVQLCLHNLQGNFVLASKHSNNSVSFMIEGWDLNPILLLSHQFSKLLPQSAKMYVWP